MRKSLVFIFLVVLALVLGACSGANDTDADAANNDNSNADVNNSDNNDTNDNNNNTNASNEDVFPDGQIELVIHAAPGGSSDTVGRIVAKEVEESLDTSIVVTNKTGGSGSIAFEFVKNSDADGYTIGFAPIEISMLKSMGYSEIMPTDFDLLARGYTMPATVTVHQDAPYDTIQEFIDYAKENPGEIKMGNSGPGAIWHIAGEAFAQEAGIEIDHIPFDGGAPAVTALMGKNVDAVPVSPSEVKSGIDGGKLKVLAVMASERHFLLPDVPTLEEEGIDLEIPVWGGFSVPKGTPEDVKEILAESIKDAILSDEFAELAETSGLTVDYLNPEEFEDFAMDQFDFYADLLPKMDLGEQ